MGDVFFKGLRGQLYLHIDDGVEHGEILRQLRRKLNASVSFFTPGTKVLLECASGECCRERVDDISSLLADYGLVLLT
ncbi:MAG: hypothetical protein N3A57_08165, partial [Negativicutes bacterium]|nr:hypothetical protein [Negativicutes bacterium]